jgi:hypothetical protein
MRGPGWVTWGRHHARLLKRLAWVFGATFVVDLVGTALVYLAERHARGTEIGSLFDAFFFTTVQLLTVSSQIKNPLTTWGRMIDIFLEIWAVIVVAGSAGAVADFFHQGTAMRRARARAGSADSSSTGRTP